MSTCIKTGVILEVVGYDNHIEGNTVYGDLHLVGNCCILYYPETQAPLEKRHGILHLDTNYPCFSRQSKPYNILVIPAKCIELNRNDIHPSDMEKFDNAKFFDGYSVRG